MRLVNLQTPLTKMSHRGPFMMREIQEKFLVEEGRVFSIYFSAIGIACLAHYLGFHVLEGLGQHRPSSSLPRQTPLSFWLLTYNFLGKG